MGCSPLLFSDTFEADTVGAPPAAYPPGNPAGDSVQIPADTSAEPAIVEVVNHPHLRGKALAYRHSGRSPFPQYVFFHAVGPGSGNTQYRAAWDGISVQSQAGDGVALSVAFGHFQDAVKLTFKDGSVFHTTFAGPDTDELREQEIGTFEPDTRHVVVLKLYRRRNTYDLSILGGVDGTPGGGNIALTDQPLLDTGIWDAPNVRVVGQFAFPGTGGTPVSPAACS